MRDFLIKIPAIFLLRLLKLYSSVICLILSENNPVAKRILWSRIYSEVGNEIKNQTQKVTHINLHGESIDLEFYVPSATCKMRADTFSSKEPEILRWIDSLGGGVFWDIGANIGLYSIYYAKNNKGPVVSFEPSVFNTAELVRNLNRNHVSERVTVVPNPLTSETSISTFRLTSYEEGGASNAFGVTYGYDGKELETNCKYEILGFSAVDLINKGYLGQNPRLVKIDVDGIEHLILNGMILVLKSDICQSVFIEVNDNFPEQALSVAEILTECGFYKHEKTHSDILNNNVTDNEIWLKSTNFYKHKS